MSGSRIRVSMILSLLISLGTAKITSAINFGAPAIYPAGSAPQGIVVADFNGDGKLDIATANTGSGNASILLGNGDGTFQAAQNFDAGMINPGPLATGDFNHDGKVDLVVVQAGTGTLAVNLLLGNGNGTFQTWRPSGITIMSGVLAVADLNGDQNSDLVVEELDLATKTATLNVFLGKGDATFQPAVVTNVANAGLGMAVADFNGDGKPDLAVDSNGAVQILLGKGDGTFQNGASISDSNGASFTVYLSADFNTDGKADLLAFRDRTVCFDFCTTQHGLYYFRGNGDGTFAPGVDIADADSLRTLLGSSSCSFLTIVIGDFNADGKFDVGADVSCSSTQSFPRPPVTKTSITGQIHLGRADGTFSPPIILNAPFTSAMSGFLTATPDLNGDKLSDLIGIKNGDVGVQLNSSQTSGADMAILFPSNYPEPAETQMPLNYGANVLNEGPQTATNVVFTDTLPNGVNFVSVTATKGSCTHSLGVVTCTVGTLASAADAGISINVIPTVAGTATNTMNVTAAEQDADSSNNTVTQHSTVQQTFTLTVTLQGDGNGTVIGDDLDCGILNGACSVRVPTGTSIQLTASPSGNSTFTGWGGVCSGSASTSCSVVVTADMAVTAGFSLPPDFTVNPSAQSMNLNRGAQATETISFPAQGGFSGTIALTCSVSGPAPMPTCGISPASVKPGDTAILTIDARSLSVALIERGGSEAVGRLLTTWLPLGLLGLVAAGFDKKRRRLWTLCVFLAAAAILPAACGGGSSDPPVQAAQNYTVSVTATSGTLQHVTAISITVK